jgi:CspA family cold shock protein
VTIVESIPEDGIDAFQIKPTPREGIVDWFDKARGWGFITADGRRYFVHHNKIIGNGFKNLLTGQRVKFLGEMGKKGWIATDVRIKFDDRYGIKQELV